VKRKRKRAGIVRWEKKKKAGGKSVAERGRLGMRECDGRGNGVWSAPGDRGKKKEGKRNKTIKMKPRRAQTVQREKKLNRHRKKPWKNWGEERGGSKNHLEETKGGNGKVCCQTN